ncbi:MAG: DUF4129 domain-containing protein [Clostridiales bacterium]|nr:DUF4129 domain-containing protein [Clostridiales bacterium]
MNSFDGAMGEVLKRSRYNNLTGRYVDWKAKLFQMLRDILQWIFERLRLPMPEFTGSNADTLVNVFVLTSLAIGLLILGVILFTAIRRFRAKRSGWRDALQGFSPDMTAEDLLRMGASLAAEGSLREAVRCGFAAILLSLDSRDIIRIGFSKTNSQLSRELKASAPEYAPDFDQAAEIFNLAWFGHKDVGRERFQMFWERAAGLIRRVEAFEVQE